MKHTVVLVDDHPVFRQGLRHLLDKAEDLRVIGEADDGQMGIEMVRELSPDLVVMDINMPNLDGIEATRRILSESPGTRVVALSVHSGKQFVRDMIQAGATGYILKESVPEEMIEGIRTAISGSIYLSRSIARTLVSDYKALLSECAPDLAAASLPILQTKLRRPAIASHMIPRVRLVEMLEKEVHNPLTLVAAPAGYGKSIVVSQWLEVSALPGAWVSLDESDNDLRRFLNYFLEAIQQVFPDCELSTKTLMKPGSLPSLEAPAGHLLNDLEALPGRFILVIDNYDRIRTSEVHDLLAELLAHPSSNLHLVLVTRRDPPLPLTSLRCRGDLTEITAKDLRFTPAETKSFLERFLRIEVTAETARILEEKMEGWATGLLLAALSIRKKTDKEHLINGLTENTQYVRDYLIQEVLSKVSSKFNRYLLHSSILDRFCAPLCQIMAADASESDQAQAGENGRDFIDWLVRTHLFVVPADHAGRWFRYHRLFQELLQKQLARSATLEEIADLHLRASRWLGENGFIQEAVRHALAGGDKSAAERYIAQQKTRAIETDSRELLGVFPDTHYETDSISPLSASLPASRLESLQRMAEPLTNRELDVLHLLDQRLRNKEIAERLFVTTETVKGHLKNIYHKLGVDNRRNAVEAAKRLRII